MMLLLAARSAAPAAAIEHSNGPLALRFDDGTGALLRISFQGQEIASGPADAPAVTFAIGPADKQVWLEQMNLRPRLVAQARPAPGTLELTIAMGDYEMVQRYVLHADLPRVDRSLRLTNTGKETVKLRSVIFRSPQYKAEGDGFCRSPAKWPPRSLPFSQFQAGRKQWGSSSSIAPMFAQLPAGRTLMWATYADDSPHVEVIEGAGSFQVRQAVHAAGYLRPNEPQDVGFVSMQVLEGDYWSALPKLWDWMDSVGLKVPADRPEWVRDAVLYSFHPAGTIGSQFRDLGGFEPATNTLLPTLPRLGVNAIWVMPIEFKSPYWPLDYYRFMEGIGTAEQYKRMVGRAHELGLRVLQDLVPHGGAPHAVHNVKEPRFMLQREDGSTLDYWLNDFARPQWQQYIAGVAGHYVREYGIDGYRVDACYGSKEANWDPQIPYARASMAQLHGGLGMLRAIREPVRQLRPDTGAILAEVESARHHAVSDFVYDFGFCYTVCPQWRRMDPAEYVTALREYLEEQKYSQPRGATLMRHVESHDSLRSQLEYGVRGMRAMYALSAWIDGVPLIYHGMEVGHTDELARINQVRRERPELRRGEALYRAVQCDAPAIFTCLRKLGDRTSVIAINFGDQPAKASLKWPGGGATVQLTPLEYCVLPSTEQTAASVALSDAAEQVIELGDNTLLAGATEWFVDTIEGRLRDRFDGPRGNGQSTKASSIYWRPQGTGDLWQHALTPLHPGSPVVGVKLADGRWRIHRILGAAPRDLRLSERGGLHLLGTGSVKAGVRTMPEPPAAPDPTAAVELAGVRLRCVGPDYIISNDHYEVRLRRQGGVLRSLGAGGTTLAREQDFYGDQEYFAHRESKTMQAASDVECGALIRVAADGLHLSFEGQLRGTPRFALKRPPLWYRNEWVFTSGPDIKQAWAFRTEKTFKDKKAFLCCIVGQVNAGQIRFARGSEVVVESKLSAGPERVAQTAGKATPDAIAFSGGERNWSLGDVRVPADAECNLFMQGQKLFITLLDANTNGLTEGRWHEFSATWRCGGQ